MIKQKMIIIWYTIIMSNLIGIKTVSSAKTDIIRIGKSEVWMESLWPALNVTYRSVTCCNILIDRDRSAMPEDFFFEFIKTYKSEYTVNEPSYDCEEYLLISRSAKKLIERIKSLPTNIGSTKLLVVAIDTLNSSMQIFNTTIFGNANVHLASLSGSWTLSENYLSPRIFERVSRFVDAARKGSAFNLQGRELIASAKYKPPYSKIETFVNRTVNGVTGEYFDPENKSELDGTDIQVFLLIVEHLNATWLIKRVPDKSQWYGRLNGTQWVGGMIGKMIEKELDIGFTSVWMSVDKFPFTNMTQPYANVRIGFLVPRPSTFTTFWALTSPLSSGVWISLLAALNLQSVCVWASARISPSFPPNFRSFLLTWTEMLGRLIGTSVPKSLKNYYLLFQMWHFTGILLVTAYSCCLAAHLTNPRYQKRIDTLEDFSGANLSWGTQGSFDYFAHIINKTDPYFEYFRSHYVSHENEEERERWISTGLYAVLGSVILSTFFPEEQLRADLYKDFRLMKYYPNDFHVAFVVQPWLLEPVDTVMLRLVETGMVQYHIDHVLHKNTGSALRSVLVELDSNEYHPTVLQLTPLGAGYVILATGFLASILVFCFELKVGNPKRFNNLKIAYPIIFLSKLWHLREDQSPAA